MLDPGWNILLSKFLNMSSQKIEIVLESNLLTVFRQFWEWRMLDRM